MIYTVTLNPALDYVLRLEKISTEDINRADETKLMYGGKGINVSLVLQHLNMENKALGLVAGFTGKELTEALERDGISTGFVELPEGITRINVKIFADEQIDINGPGPKVPEESVQAFFKTLDQLKENDILVLAGAVPSNVPDNIYEEIMKYLAGKGVHFVVDTTGEGLLKVLPYKPFLIKPNHHELSEIFEDDVKSTDTDKIVKYAKELRKMGAKNVLVSRGKHGATLVDENDDVHHAGIVPGKPVNNVGCGDSMVAGFVAGYVKERDYDYALRLGSAAGNASAFVDGIASGEAILSVLNDYFPGK